MESVWNTVDGLHIRKESGRLAAGLLLYSVLMVVCVTVQALVNAGGISDEALTRMEEQSGQSGLGYLIAMGLGLLFLRFFYRKLERPRMFQRRRSMNSDAFLRLLCVLMSAQMIFVIFAWALEHLFNLAGYSVLGAVEAASSGSTTTSMFLYASLLGPVSEELIFRGFVMQTLKKHGKTFAILVSALLFSAYHGNFVQGIFAFLVGLVLGYVAMEYSLGWAIGLHILNNCVFGDLLLYATRGMPEQVQNLILSSMDLFFLTAGLIILIRMRGEIVRYLRENRTGGYRYVFTSVGVLLFLAAMAVAAFLGLEKI
ncbi:MAG: CPBP family intramembrane metalloprotease [Intestinimonas sp.]|jgi:membrane protease YdiL (CAAX protease family)|nr:CPBP family intramembrane metalloprotease [Intestinimonas sp.]